MLLAAPLQEDGAAAKFRKINAIKNQPKAMLLITDNLSMKKMEKKQKINESARDCAWLRYAAKKSRGPRLSCHLMTPGGGKSLLLTHPPVLLNNHAVNELVDVVHEMRRICGWLQGPLISPGGSQNQSCQGIYACAIVLSKA